MDLNELALASGKNANALSVNLNEPAVHRYISSSKMRTGKRRIPVAMVANPVLGAGTTRKRWWPVSMRGRQRYNLKVRFCKEETTGSMIHDICRYHLKEVLQNE